jgi:hypothetical protein
MSRKSSSVRVLADKPQTSKREDISMSTCKLERSPLMRERFIPSTFDDPVVIGGFLGKITPVELWCPK